MLRVLLATLVLLPWTTTLAAPAGVEPPGSFAVATGTYSAELSWPGALATDGPHATLAFEAAGRSGTMELRAAHLSDTLFRARLPTRPLLAEAIVDASGAPPSVTLVYDFAGSALLAETTSVIRFEFHGDRIEYHTTLRAPNGIYVSFMRAETSLVWDSPWQSRGIILPDGSLSNNDGRGLDPFQEWEVVDPYGVYVAGPAGSHAQVRIANGDQLNYLEEGRWRVTTSSATTWTVYNTFLDAPSLGMEQALWARDALLFGDDPAALGARLLTLAMKPEIPSRASQDRQVVIGLADSGINPYHIAFRDTSPLAYQHPSTYIEGYPADAIALHLSLNASTLATAKSLDAAVWASVVPGKLYWFPGTKIVGGVAGGVTGDPDARIYSEGHGTMTASRAAANEYSLCPECRIVMYQAGAILADDGARAIRWMAEQEWIDVQSHSWSGFVPFQNDVEIPGVRAAMTFAAAQMPVFSSAGNGAGGKLGVLGHPAFTRPMSGAPGAIPVGGHDGGMITAWTAQYPYVVADACSSWAAVGSTLDHFDPEEGGGTSASTPYAAGEAGRLILEARRLLGDEGDRSTGVLAKGAPRPDLGASPLADGTFTLDELKSVLFRTATARPEFTRDDGSYCTSPGSVPSNTVPMSWRDFPEDVSAYPFIGWGGIDVHSLARAIDVLHGAPVPLRPLDEEAHAQAEALREAYRAVEP